jgi:hypothetical protein
MAYSLSIPPDVCSMLGMATRYIINLTEEERLGLEDLASGKRVSKLKVQRAQILPKADEGLRLSSTIQPIISGQPQAA